MITPINYLLSGYNKNYEYDFPIDIFSYLSDADCKFIISETDNLIYTVSETLTPDLDNLESDMIGTLQVIGNRTVTIDTYTALLLNRIKQAGKYYKAPTEKLETYEGSQLRTIAQRIEGNPKYVYTYVLDILSNSGNTIKLRLEKISSLLAFLFHHTNLRKSNTIEQNEMQERLSRLTLHSNESYWKKMLTLDYLRQYHSEPTPFNITIIQKELSDLGIYGFINPLKMYNDFAHSRIVRQTSLNIDYEVLDFLADIILSGGLELPT